MHSDSVNYNDDDDADDIDQKLWIFFRLNASHARQH